MNSKRIFNDIARAKASATDCTQSSKIRTIKELVNSISHCENIASRSYIFCLGIVVYVKTTSKCPIRASLLVRELHKIKYTQVAITYYTISANAQASLSQAQGRQT